jgi:hypothetical protein
MLPMPSGAVVAFLDTEGFSASDRTADYDAKIFALSALLSSHLLYNSVRIIDTASIERVPTPPPRAPSPPRIQHKQGVDPQRKILCVCVCVLGLGLGLGLVCVCARSGTKYTLQRTLWQHDRKMLLIRSFLVTVHAGKPAAVPS